MRPWKIVFACLVLSTSLYAQDQLAVRLNEQGLIKVLEMALKYNTANGNGRTVVIPQNLYEFTIPRENLSSNPVVSVVNQISDLNLNRDLEFYLHTADIKVSGQADPDSIKAQISNSRSTGFDLRLSLSLPRIQVSGANLSLCEDKDRNRLQCGSGLKASLSNLSIVTKNRPVNLSMVLRLRTENNVARVSVVSVDSNLEGRRAPSLDINFRSINIPPISIVINGQETELDTSRLRDEILKRKSFLAAKLMGFAADFIASDVAEMLNVYLINKEVATSWQVYNRDVPIRFDEFLSDRLVVAQDNTYVRPRIRIPQRQLDPITTMMDQIADVIRHARVGLALNKISTPGNKDIELGGIVHLVLNNRAMNVRNTLGNSNRKLPPLNLNGHRNNDINVAISEPLLNGALDLAASTGLFQELFDEFAKMPGFYIKNVKVHFISQNKLTVVVNSAIDLKEVGSDSIAGWIKNRFAAFLERNNNNSVIYFPIQVDVVPRVVRLNNGGVGLHLYVGHPFNANGLKNSYNYPSNVAAMKDVVKEGVMDKLKESLGEYTNEWYSVDLNKFLNQAGVEFLPKMIAVDQNAYLLLNLDIVDIKFDSKNPNKR